MLHLVALLTLFHSQIQSHLMAVRCLFRIVHGEEGNVTVAPSTVGLPLTGNLPFLLVHRHWLGIVSILDLITKALGHAGCLTAIKTHPRSLQWDQSLSSYIAKSSINFLKKKENAV